MRSSQIFPEHGEIYPEPALAKEVCVAWFQGLSTCFLRFSSPKGKNQIAWLTYSNMLPLSSISLCFGSQPDHPLDSPGELSKSLVPRLYPRPGPSKFLQWDQGSKSLQFPKGCQWAAIRAESHSPGVFINVNVNTIHLSSPRGLGLSGPSLDAREEKVKMLGFHQMQGTTTEQGEEPSQGRCAAARCTWPSCKSTEQRSGSSSPAPHQYL
jgi:hypothetical protein